VHERDGNLTTIHLQEQYPHLYHQGVWIFGELDKGLRAAGFDPERTRIRSSPDGKRIVKEIRAMRRANLPLNAHYVLKHRPKLFSAAIRHFGSWTEALIAAGIIRKHFANKLHTSSLGVLRALRDTLETNSKDNIPQILRLQAELYFGSLRKATNALEKDERLMRGWSKLKIIKVQFVFCASQVAQSGLGLNRWRIQFNFRANDPRIMCRRRSRLSPASACCRHPLAANLRYPKISLSFA
jgi:hypothetical protein